MSGENEQTYRVNLVQSANLVIDVKASTPAEAIERAEVDAYAGLCHQCARQIDIDSGAWEAIQGIEPEVVT